MAINKKLIHFKKYETFIGSQGINGATSPRDGYYGNIPETSIVFIQDVRQIWTHGLLYDCDPNAVLTNADGRYKKIQTAVSSPTASTTTSTTFIDTISQDVQGKITATKKTLPAGASCTGTVTSVKVGTTSYSPSSGVISLPAYPTAADLGLSSALKFIGTTSTALTDGSTTQTITIGSNSVKASTGDVVISSSTDKEFVWTGSAWEELGDASSFKKVLTAVADSGSGYVSAVTQNTQGVISVTKTALPASLKNPTALSWSGYNSGSYDGSAAKSFVIPSNTNLLTNGAGYITGITKAMVTTALGYIPPTSDTWRDIYINGTKYSGSAIDFTAGSNVSLTLGTADNGGKQALTIAATNTTNTAGSSNKTGTKLLLVGATSTTTGLTYTNSNCYIGTDNCLYSGGTKVLTSHQSLSGYLTSTTAASTYLAKAGGTTTGLINLNGATYNDTLKISNKDYATAYAQIFMGGGDDFVIRQVLVSTGVTTDLRFNGTRLIYTKDLSIGGAATITGAISAQGAKFYTNANGVYWTSDRKFKDCIKSPVKNGMLDDETGLIRKFNWKDTGKASCGFIAQELLPYVPEAVDYDKELNKYSVNYDVAHSALLGLLVIKIKELESEIKSLKSKIN